MYEVKLNSKRLGVALVIEFKTRNESKWIKCVQRNLNQKLKMKNCNEQAGAELGQAQPKARSKFEVKPEVKIEGDINNWRNLKMKKLIVRLTT